MGAQRRRDELTFRDNRHRGRHGWLRLTPAYSVRVVEELLDQAAPGERVLDPFSGTGTTPLCAVQRGHDAASVDINPFLVWLGNAKLARYGEAALRRAREAAREVSGDVARGDAPAAPPPPMHNIERWWPPRALAHLCALRGAIDRAAPRRGKVRDLLEVALCRRVIDLSRAAFNHQSMSFLPVAPGDADAAPEALLPARFVEEVERLLETARVAPRGEGRVRQGDARALTALAGETFDRVVTSPPYPNRMSYVRELRPYMYWTGHLAEAREAGELDWRAIGGTWGVATSRLAEWRPSSGWRAPAWLAEILPAIEEAHPRNGPLLARYVGRYAEDTARHLEALRPLVRQGGTIAYVVGNSSFYGRNVPVERLYAELMERAGFRAASARVLRKRTSKKELFEYVVTARA